MQNKSEEELLDYNDLEEEKENGSDQGASNTPPQTPVDLISDNDEGEEGDKNEKDLEEGQEVEIDTQSTH
jgi:hypothetical protein